MPSSRLRRGRSVADSYTGSATMGSMARDIIHPAELSDPSPYNHSHAIVEDGVLFMSGQVAVDREGNTVGDDAETQARKAFENVGHLLDAVDRDFGDVTKVTSYLVDAQETYDGFMRAYRSVFETPPYPCHTVLGVATLPSPALLVELEVEVPVEASDDS